MAKKNRDNSEFLENKEPTQPENTSENENNVVISDEKPKGIVEVETEIKNVPVPKKGKSLVKTWKSSLKK